jgi:hypothetical protein
VRLVGRRTRAPLLTTRGEGDAASGGQAKAREAADQSRGAGDDPGLREPVCSERRADPRNRITSPLGGGRLVEEVELPAGTKRLADASQLVDRRGRPEDVDVDGEDLVESPLARIEGRDVDGRERKPPGHDVLLANPLGNRLLIGLIGDRGAGVAVGSWGLVVACAVTAVVSAPVIARRALRVGLDHVTRRSARLCRAARCCVERERA